MKKKFKILLFVALIAGHSSYGAFLNSWHILNGTLPEYFVTPFFLSGTLLLYDRPMFFETREIEYKEFNSPKVERLDFDLQIAGYNSYLHRRLFRFATNETRCGVDQKKAFDLLFCKPLLLSLNSKKIEFVSVNFVSHVGGYSTRNFEYSCER